MKRLLIGVFIVLINCQIFGAIASWNEIHLQDYWIETEDQMAKMSTLTGGVRDDDGAGAIVQGIIFTRTGTEGTYIKAYDYSITAAPVNTRWLLAFYGDVLDESTFPMLEDVELTTRYDFGTGGDKIANPSDFYLVFVTEDWDDYISGAENPHIWYGWVNLAVNADGALDVLGSDITVYGDVLTVGGAYSIPEPSGGLLFVLGAAALGLRRRRVSPPYRGGVRSRAAAASVPDLSQSTPKTRISSVRRWR